MNCQEFEELSGAYALDALTDEERRAADEHLAHCEKCRRALQQLRSVVDLFPLTVPPAEPSPRVKERILARIEAQAQHMSQATTPLNAGRGSRPSPRRAERRRLWSLRALAAVAVLLLALLAGMTAWNISLQQQVTRLSSTPAVPIVYQLYGTALARNARGEVMYFPRQQVTVVVVYGLPPLEGTQVYQGWLLQNHRPTSIGLFTMENGIARLDFQGRITGYDTVAISREAGPQPSVNVPKGPVVAAGMLDDSLADLRQAYHGLHRLTTDMDNEQ
jgi:anti-sigma-K factor RskA